MLIESRRGMIVEMPDDEHAKWVAEYGDKTREKLLSQAGRVHKHRQQLHMILSQQLDVEQVEQVKRLAKILARTELVDKKIEENGYGTYLTRRDRGGLMPESWSRIVARAETAVADIEVSGDHLENLAMIELGFYTPEDRAWSERVIFGCKWRITAPDNWGGECFKELPLGH